MKVHKAACLASVFVLAASLAAAQTFNGPNFVVETYITGAQGAADVVIDPGGHFIVTWAGESSHDSLGVSAQMFKSSGVPMGTQFAVNTYTTDEQSLPAVAVARNGRFVVVWQSWQTDGDMYGVNGRLFAPDGTPIGGEFQVNSFTTGYQYLPDVAFNSDGSFVVTWQTDDLDGDYYGIAAQRFDNNANRLGAEFVVNTYTTGYQYNPKILATPLGFAIAWDGAGTGDADGIFARGFLANGVPVGAQFRVNTGAATNYQRYVSVASGGGAFVVAWEDVSSSAPLERDVWARRFNSSFVGGAQFRVNTSTADYQRRPSVGMDNLAQFVVAWHSGTPYGAYQYDVRARQFDSVGTAVGTEFTVNTTTAGNQGYASVSGWRNGTFVVVWEGDETGSLGVRGQRLGDLIFSDNFETF
jgi:hypothetical protein